jgi:hypothetical protein
MTARELWFAHQESQGNRVQELQAARLTPRQKTRLTGMLQAASRYGPESVQDILDDYDIRFAEELEGAAIARTRAEDVLVEVYGLPNVTLAETMEAVVSAWNAVSEAVVGAVSVDDGFGEAGEFTDEQVTFGAVLRELTAARAVAVEATVSYEALLRHVKQAVTSEVDLDETAVSTAINDDLPGSYLLIAEHLDEARAILADLGDSRLTESIHVPTFDHPQHAL